MKTTNKILSIILAILMIISIIPITASATTYSGTCGDNMTWELDKTTGVLTFSGSGEMRFYTSSNTPWDTYKNYIKEVVINEGITTIGEYAFYKLYITDVTLPNSLIRIEDYAFCNCTKLTSITIPNGVKQIDACAFSNCTGLTSITMYKGVVFISDNAFAKCTALTDVYYSGSQKDWNLINIHSGNGNLVNANITYAEGGSFTWDFNKETGTLTFTGNGEIPDYYNEDEDYFIKQPWDDIEKDIKHIVFNEGISRIGAYAFANLDFLETVTMSSVVTIGHHAFYNCPVLKKLTTSNSLKFIGEHAFRDCKKFTYIYYSGTQEEWNNVSIGEHWNDEMDKVKVYPSDYVVYSDSGTFKAITGGKTFSWVFDADSFTLTISGEGDMSGLFISVPWDKYKFDIERLVFADGITSICPTIFAILPNLTEISIPESVIKISNQAFNSCGSITDVYYSGTEEQWNNITIGTGNDSLLNAKIHYNSTGPHTHDYEIVVTDPTCTKQGYTTYTCECSDSYVDNYVGALGHTEETIPAVAPTCTETGLTEGSKCSVCGEKLTEQKTVDALGHTPANAVEENYVAPSCTENGSKDIVIYCSVCEDEIIRETVVINATGPADNDGDGYCDDCHELLDPTVDCECNCHKSGIEKFFFKFILFFQKIFGLNKECACGVIHY